MKKLLLISNRVMHYRVSVYNYLSERFKEYGWELLVRSNELQKENPYPLKFNFMEMEFGFYLYRQEIERIKPEVVIIFLHLKDLMIWPLVHWLKFKGIPVVFWMKAMNYDEPNNVISYLLYKYMHGLLDGLILHSECELKYISRRNRHKAFAANNTINFQEYPEISESREEIKREFGVPFEKVVLSVGRMGAGGGRKKVDHLIQIFNEMKYEGIGLVIIGSGMSSDLLRKLNKKNTIYLGEIHDPKNVQISKIFKMADVFSIPGHVGLGLNQAFYWGLPVVTEDGLQPPEIHYLINGRNGFIVPNNNLAELKNKIMYLLNNDQVRREFSENARKDILENASIENMFNGFKRCIEFLK
ncbi:MAG: glycosyltransferase family 4 protein [Thermodesulfobacteriota bacterium]